MTDSSLTLVAGLGKTGLSITHYLKRRNRAFVMFDTRNNPPGLDEFKCAFPAVDFYVESVPEEVIATIAEVIASPGISLDDPTLHACASAGIPIIGDIECLVREITAPIVAITGTNGKSTVTTLVGEMAKAAGMNVAVAGNIGEPVLDVGWALAQQPMLAEQPMLGQGPTYDLWVLELSSFQLDLTFSLKARAATILNVSPDHLDRHHNMANYIASKQRIYHEAQWCLFSRDDSATKPFVAAPMTSFGISSPKDQSWGIQAVNQQHFLAYGQDLLLDVTELKIKGKHNWLNALAAFALARQVGIPDTAILQVLRTFKGLSHRCEWIRDLDNITYINDSKGTNIGATQSAVQGIGEAIDGQIVLIAGGLGKGADFRDLQDCVKAHVRALVLIGQDASLIAAALAQDTAISFATSLEHAVEIARLSAKAGDVVLLSPACASQDMFTDFNHRGQVFTDHVRQLS